MQVVIAEIRPLRFCSRLLDQSFTVAAYSTRVVPQIPSPGCLGPGVLSLQVVFEAGYQSHARRSQWSKPQTPIAGSQGIADGKFSYT